MSLIRTIDNLEILEETINDTISDHLNNVRLKKMTIFEDFLDSNLKIKKNHQSILFSRGSVQNLYLFLNQTYILMCNSGGEGILKSF